VKTTSIRDFRHNDDAKKFFLSTLTASQSVFDRQHGDSRDATAEPTAKDCGYPNAACVRTRPEVVCQAHAAVEVVPTPGSSAAQAPAGQRLKVSATALSLQETMSLDQNLGRAWYADYVYDRRQPTCCVPWQWESGQVRIHVTRML
jgi:hypothetical protein